VTLDLTLCYLGGVNIEKEDVQGCGRIENEHASNERSDFGARSKRTRGHSGPDGEKGEKKKFD